MNSAEHKSNAEEDRLVSLLRQKDRRAMTELYDRYSAALYYIVLRVIPEETAAQEALQDAFVKIWHNFEKYDPDKGRLFTWMAQITRNTTIDTVRSSQYRKGEKTGLLPDSVYNDSSLSETQVHTDIGLRKVLHLLEEQHRKIIDLLYFQDYTQKEVGEALNMPLGTVKSRARKAISQLRAILSGERMVVIASFIVLEFLK